MNISWKILILALPIILQGLSGCTGHNAFGLAARSGDTIAITVGYYPNLSRQGITVTVKDNLTVYAPGHDNVRGLINAYPDPLSYLVVGKTTNQDLTDGFESGLGSIIEFVTTDGSKEYLQTTLIMDLPQDMATGEATIEITPVGETTPIPVAKVKILEDPDDLNGNGSSDLFGTHQNVTIVSEMIKTMERADHYEISFQASPVPYAIQIDFKHDADVDNLGVGRAHVVNPRGDIKTVSWSDTDNGTKLKAIILPSKNQTLTNMKDFKFLGDKMREKEFKDFTIKAKQGFKKFSSLCSDEMEALGKDYARETGRIKNHMLNKEHFFEWCEGFLNEVE